MTEWDESRTMRDGTSLKLLKMGKMQIAGLARWVGNKKYCKVKNILHLKWIYRYKFKLTKSQNTHQISENKMQISFFFFFKKHEKYKKIVARLYMVNWKHN